MCASTLTASMGVRDPEFDKVPFAQWLSEVSLTKWKWKVRLLPVTLSAHQRLLAKVQIEVDGSDLVKKRQSGKFIVFFQFTDAGGRVFQDHASIGLEKVPQNLTGSVITVSDTAFVLPGEFRVALAIWNIETGEHSVKQDILLVEPIHSDPLPLLWQKLPSLEFVNESGPPDCWFLPKEQDALNLPVGTRRPLRIDVIANVSSSGDTTNDSDLAFVLPYVKVLVQVRGKATRIDVSLIDVEGRRVLFEQRDVERLDWAILKSSLAKANPNTIDIHALAHREQTADFLVQELGRRLNDDHTAARLVIVLSGAVYFDQVQEVLDPGFPRTVRFVYVRVRGATLDQLARTLPVPGVLLFDVLTPDDFRNALQQIVLETEQM